VSAANKAQGQGSVYVFQRSGTAWSYQQELMEQPSGQPNDCFGCALALHGNTAVIGATGASGNLGEAFVYTSSGASWTKQASFLGAATTDFFAFSVALTPDESTAFVGAFGTASQKGSVYVFTRAGTVWSQPTPPFTATDGHAGDRFGYALGAGSGTAIVGAYAKGPGAAYIFSGSGATWSQQAELTQPSPTGSDAFGISVAIDGNMALVGADEHGGTNGPGAAYLFTSSGGLWTQPPQTFSAVSQNEEYGYSVGLSAGSAVIGSFGAANQSGAAYLLGPAVVGAPALGGRPHLAALALLLGAVGAFVVRTRRGERAL
jgi:hypothetical protein